MSTRRSFLIGGATAAAGMAYAARSEAVALRPVVPGIWFFEGDFLTNGRCNSVVIERQHDLVVVDANSAGGALALQSELRKFSSKPVRHVLLTHHHGDHIYGNAVWTRSGATTVAHRTMLNELARIEPARWQQQAAHDSQAAALGQGPEPPRQTFDGNQWVLDDGDRRIEMHYFGGAHTQDDVLVYLPRERVLCPGDVAINTALNSFSDSDFRHWPTVLQAAVAFGAQHVLPGHGDAGGPEILTGQARFLTTLGEAVEKRISTGQTAERIAAGLEFPDELKPWVNRTNLPQQIEQICALRTGTAK